MSKTICPSPKVTMFIFCQLNFFLPNFVEVEVAVIGVVVTGDGFVSCRHYRCLLRRWCRFCAVCFGAVVIGGFCRSLGCLWVFYYVIGVDSAPSVLVTLLLVVSPFVGLSVSPDLFQISHVCFGAVMIASVLLRRWYRFHAAYFDATIIGEFRRFKLDS
ncbi:5648_t:CDS:2 [Cetraspora pellucida]|uniref:5648_t:CDS:1 n=1 Tax=Cetraspora pellucida TaxID=1433469 RepID=A0A9N8W4M1_9GLOM|nr:5648_t:CDS:2 [Cetraspora pellucida]